MLHQVRQAAERLTTPNGFQELREAVKTRQNTPGEIF